MIYIYALRDPTNSYVRYVGKTNNPERRLKAHIQRSKTSRLHSSNWIRNVLKNGLFPMMDTFWLNGFFEITESEGLNERQVSIIKDHLKLVFQKETPDRSIGSFLGKERELFDDKYVKDALGIGDQKMQICGAKPWMHEPNNELENLGHPIPTKFDDFLLHSDNLPPLGEIQTRLDRMTNYPLNVNEGSFSYPLVQNIVGCSC